MSIFIMQLIVLSTNLVVDDVKNFFPLQVGNYWEYGISDIFLNSDNFDKARITDSTTFYIDRDTLVDGKIWFHINHIFPRHYYYQKYWSNIWLIYDYNDNLLARDSFFKNEHKALNFGDLKDSIQASTLNSFGGILNEDIDAFSIPRILSYRPFSFSFGCNTENMWIVTPYYYLSFLPQKDTEEVYCLNVGPYGFIREDSYFVSFKYFLIKAYINGVMYKELLQTNPTTWLEIKQGK
jgi:hypothetical protein